jgi:hypothetical protein
VSRLALVVVMLGLPLQARAHFVLDAPPNWQSQDFLGSPQKTPPCGTETAATPSGVVTPYFQGDTVTVTINETIPHPGHYRVVLGVNGQASLPADPVVTPGATPCGTTVIEAVPTFPALADGQLVHTAALSGMQSFTVKLPSNVTCTNCVLQVQEFMSNHGINVPGGCWYHHCANISIAARPAADAGSPVDAGTVVDAGAATDAGSTPTDSGVVETDAGSTVDSGTPAQDAGVLADGGTDPGGQGGCSCGTVDGLAVMLAAGLVLASRRQRS